MNLSRLNIMTTRRLCAGYFLLSLLLLSEPLWAKGMGSEDGASRLAMRGEWTHEMLGWIDLFTVALFDDPEQRAAPILGPIPKRLVVHYERSISADQLSRVTRDGIARNVTPGTLARLDDRITRFNDLYRSVRPGDYYEVIYTPGRGTELRLNGRSLGEIEGDEFAEAFFAIWLGAAPIDIRLREGLLGEG